jgi:tripartite-type tricarboxylate transporter receptor subunit TctC
MDRRHFHAHTLALLAGAAAPAWAQSRPAGPGGYPERLVSLIVPYPAGGIVDVVTRTVVDPLSATLPNRIVVDNRAGADGRIGLKAALQAQADGYMLVAATPIVAVGEHLFPDVAGLSQNFVGVCGIAAPPSVWVVWSGLPVHNLKELVSAAAAKPGSLNVVVPGSGSSLHLAQELLFERTGMKVTNINYKGQPPALPDLAEGRVHLGLVSQSLALPLIQTGKLRALAVNAGKRTRSLPDVPTVAEAGFPETLVQSWYGIAAPKGTPPAIIQYLSDGLLATLAQPAVRARYEATDNEILAQDSTTFDALIKSENQRWGGLIRSRGIKVAG